MGSRFRLPIKFAMRMSVIAYLIMIAATVLARMRPAGKARGAEPRISAFVRTFMFTVLVLFPRPELTPAAAAVSTLLTVVGNAFAIVVLTQLRSSFSMMAEARQLVTSGV